MSESALASSPTTPPLPWQNSWYAVHFVQDLDRTKPTSLVILDTPLVIWWHGPSDQWVVQSDRCPHRLAALSEGRINEAGCLECPYHGWAFSHGGRCEVIPFDREDGTAHQSPRAQLPTYVSEVAQGILFVFLGDRALAAQTPLPLVTPLEQHQDQWITVDVCRDLPYDVTTLMENVLDTSHVSFTHHPRVGNRANAKEFALEVSEITPQGFTGLWPEGPRQGRLGSQKTTFCAPSLMWHDIEDSPFGQVMTVVYGTPMEKGRCRAIVRLPFRFKSPIPRLVFQLTPRWFSHLNQMGILEDDQIFLHLQERELAKSPKTYSQQCYLPTQSDRFVLAYHQWLGRHGEPFPDQDFPPAQLNRQLLLERYQSHTEICHSCRRAHRNLTRLYRGAIALLGLLSVGLPLGVALGAGVNMVGAIALVVVILGGITWKLHGVIQRFSQGEYPPTRNYK